MDEVGFCVATLEMRCIYLMVYLGSMLNKLIISRFNTIKFFAPSYSLMRIYISKYRED